jgi:endoglucanase
LAADDHSGRSSGIEKRMPLGRRAVIVVPMHPAEALYTQVVDWLDGTAKEFNIPAQLEVSEGGTTDATAIYLSRSGIPTGVLSVPTRYIHSPVEVLSLDDIDKAAELMARALETAPMYFKR